MRSARLKICALALVATLSMPAFSQETNGAASTPATTTGATSVTPNTGVRHDDDRGSDWGWLGLVGLAGLLGLRKPPAVIRNDTTRTPSR